MDMLRRRKDEHPGETWWYILGVDGATSFSVFHVNLSGGMRAYHSPRPHFEGHEPATEPCDVLETACYNDGSFVAGSELCKAWKAAGQNDDVIWAELERYYAVTFEPAKKVAS